MNTSIHLTGGLGNQLFQLAAGLFVSQESELELVTQYGAPRSNPSGKPDIGEYRLPENVRFAATEVNALHGLRSKAIGVNLRRGTLMEDIRQSDRDYTGALIRVLASMAMFRPRNRFQHMWVARGGGYDSALSYRQRGNLLVGYYQTWRYLENPFVSNALNSLSLVEEPNWLPSLREQAVVEQPLVVHVRMGDYRESGSPGLLSDEYFKQAIAKHRERGNVGKIWLFSDEPRIAMGIVSQWESDTAIRNIDLEFPNASPAQSLEAMRLGHAFVVSNSTFSWWAASLAHVNSPKVVSPKPWFRSGVEPLDIVPPGWTRLAR